MVFTDIQKAQVKMQLEKHNRPKVLSEIILDSITGKKIEFIFEKNVFGSDIMSSGIYLARFLYKIKLFYSDKICLDLGCGNAAIRDKK